MAPPDDTAYPDGLQDSSAIEADGADPELLPDDVRNDVVVDDQAPPGDQAGSPPADAVTEP